MRRFFSLAMLIIGVALQTHGQFLNNPFQLQNNPFHRKFFFDLGNQNKMQIETSHLEDLPFLFQLDSIVNTFLIDMATLQDTIQPDVASRTIEYAIDTSQVKRISISSHPAPRLNYLLNQGELTALKVVQDTIIIYGKLPGGAASGGKGDGKSKTPHYFRVSLFLNDFGDLSRYQNRLGEKVRRVYSNIQNKWQLRRDGLMHLKDHPDITAKSPRGKVGTSFLFAIRSSADIQNYKDKFVPSVSAGFTIVRDKNLVHQEYYFGNEFHWTFSRPTGNRNASLNHFIVVSHGRSKINPQSGKAYGLYPFMSLAYLVRQRGDVFERHSFRLGLGQINLFGGSTKVEPCFYFTGFLHGVTPSFRLTQQF